MTPYSGPGNIAATAPTITTAGALQAISSQHKFRPACSPQPPLKLCRGLLIKSSFFMRFTRHSAGFGSLKFLIYGSPKMSGFKPCFGRVRPLHLSQKNVHLLVIKNSIEKSGSLFSMILSVCELFLDGFSEKGETRLSKHLTLHTNK